MSDFTVLPEELDISSDEKNDAHLDELFTIVKDGFLLDMNHIQDLKKELRRDEGLLSDYKAIVRRFNIMIREKQSTKDFRSRKKVVVTYDDLEELQFKIDDNFTRDDKLVTLRKLTHSNQDEIEYLERQLLKSKRLISEFESKFESFDYTALPF